MHVLAPVFTGDENLGENTEVMWNTPNPIF
jgi:hypothetical protein